MLSKNRYFLNDKWIDTKTARAVREVLASWTALAGFRVAYTPRWRPCGVS